MALNDVIVTFRLPSPITVTRSVPETYVSGRRVPDPSPTVFVINDTEANAVSSVPSSGQRVEQLPEGQLAENTRTIYSKVPLQARSPAGPGDVLALSDGNYEVVTVHDWAGLRGDGSQNCWECTAAKQETP